jgi:hypothetical protein
MSTSENVEYQVVLVFPGFGTERENAEQVVEEALHYLNTEKDEPGMRFAQNVSARLEIVADAEQAHAKLETDDDLATMILHDLADDERTALTLACVAKGVPVCHTVAPREGESEEPRPAAGKRREWKLVFTKKREGDDPPAHKITETTLTGPLDGNPDEVGARIGQVIAVLALGVMEHHWRRQPPRHFMPM